MTGTDRLHDPGEHYPYKLEHVLALIEEDPPAGPTGPDDDSTRIGEYISRDIALASAAYVDAQAQHVREGTDESLAAYKSAAADLEEARATHRAPRGGDHVVVGIRRGI